MKIMIMTTETIFDVYKNELSAYVCKDKLPNGAVLHLARLGESEVYIGTLTCFNKEGLKDERALPFQTFINVVNQLENFLGNYKNTAYTGRVIGWNPTEKVKDFLYEKKVHRVFFIRRADVFRFLEEYTGKEATFERSQFDVNMALTFS
ncbi:hypothetical protein [Bacillus phage YungSlug]|nr:hypothetical protein [Bacillus phage YungSlug]